MPLAPKLQVMSTAPGSDQRQQTIQQNSILTSLAGVNQYLSGDVLGSFFGVGANSTAQPLARASTDDQLSTAAMTFTIAGVATTKAASAAGTAFGSLGTIPASTWGLIAVDVVAAGTITYVSAAASYTTGYATEALAIAAAPARVTVKARVGYITILASSSGFVVDTDALAGGSSGNPATTTNYYPQVGVNGATGVATGPNGVVSCYYSGAGSPWTGGRNGVLQATTLSRGTTVTLASSAFMFNANGLNNVPKAATTATSIGALGTIPADQWGLVVAMIDGAGAITFLSAPANYTTGYATEAAAIADLSKIYPGSTLCMMGWFTVKTKAATAFIFATDSLAGGATGNVASFTNYYAPASVVFSEGLTAALIATTQGTPVSSAQY